MNHRQQLQDYASTRTLTQGDGFKLKSKFWLWAIFPLIFIVYALLLTKNYYWDGIFFALTIESAPDLNPNLLHPNHLLYNVLGYLVYQAARVADLEPRAVTILQLINCFISATSAYVLFRILLDCFKSVYLSLALTLLFAFSATWWKFSTDADSYITSVLFLLISFYLLLPTRTPRPYLVGVSHALSMLFHQLAVFFFPVVILGLYLQSKKSKKRPLPSILKYGFTAFLLTFPLFYYSFYLVTGSFDFKQFFRWITTFSPEHGFTFHAWDNFVYTLRGHSRLFFGGRISFLRETGSPLIIALFCLLLILACVFFFKLIRHFKELKVTLRAAIREGDEFRNLRILSIVWIVVYLLFLFFFIPQNTFYRLFYLPAIIVLIGTFLAPYETHLKGVRRRYRLLMLAALMFTGNLAFNIYPYSQVRANPPLALALELKEGWPHGTIIYLSAWNSDNLLVKYFNPATEWRVIKREALERELQNPESGGNAVWLDTTIVEQYLASPDGTRWLEINVAEKRELVNDKYKLRFYKLK